MSLDDSAWVRKPYPFAETHHLPASVLTPIYSENLLRLLGKVNRAPFRNQARAHVLFCGATIPAEADADGSYAVTFRFAIGRGVSRKQVMAQGGATPAGFPTLRGGLGLLAIQALTEHPMRVCEVYDEGDFAELGIGTEPLEHPDD